MDSKTRAFRALVREQITLLARASLQAEYERDVAIADVPAELICRFCDDLFHPKSQIFLKAFTEDEIKRLAVLYGLLHVAAEKLGQSSPGGVAGLQKLPEWRAVMAFAKELEADLDRSDGND